MKSELKTMLIRKRILIERKMPDTNYKYFNAYLLANFGIVVDKPRKLTKDMVEDIAEEYFLRVPASFYNNPQDTRLFECEELLFEQLVSYFAVESGLGIYDRIELFKKDLPQYMVGDEIKLREFKIVSERQAKEELRNIGQAFCNYTRPFSNQDLAEFTILFKEGFVDPTWEIRCKDNLFDLLELDISYAAYLDHKDIVKYSIKLFGEVSNLKERVKHPLNKDRFTRLMMATKLSKPCEMTKKQAKYFNKLIDLYNHMYAPEHGKTTKMKLVVANSPHKEAIKLLKQGEVFEAAKVYAAHGSLLERNLKMLLSRANPRETNEILDLLPAKNPIVLYQLTKKLNENSEGPRTFTFTTNRLVKKHIETDYETKWRKSRLSLGTVEYVRAVCLNRMYGYYRTLPSLGSVYIDDAFHNIALPVNTSASGKGIDALPTGSRLPLNTPYIRTYVTWKHAFDIDAAMTVITEDSKYTRTVNFTNYTSKPYGNALLFSGDCRYSSGTEYFDVDVETLKSKYKVQYLLLSFNGFNDDLNAGEIYCGYQKKKNLNTEAWDPKNIELQYRVKGDTRASVGLLFDFVRDEVVIINLMIASANRVANDEVIAIANEYKDPSYLEDVNIGKIAAVRGVVVSDPATADYVFSDIYKPSKDAASRQTIIHTYDVEKLVSLANARE